MGFGEEVVAAFLTDVLTVSRTAAGAPVDGIWIKPASTTFTIQACVQPAHGLQRVTGGRDMSSKTDGEHVDDVRVIYTSTQLHTRTPDYEPDEVTLEDGQWVVIRVEKWFLVQAVNTHYQVLVTRLNLGAS